MAAQYAKDLVSQALAARAANTRKVGGGAPPPGSPFQLAPAASVVGSRHARRAAQAKQRTSTRAPLVVTVTVGGATS